MGHGPTYNGGRPCIDNRSVGASPSVSDDGASPSVSDEVFDRGLRPVTATFRAALASVDFRRLLVSHALATTAALMLAMAVGVEVLARTGSGL